MTTIALVGNPNCGKTTLFNLLTGSRQRVGNRAGVTTEKKEGIYRKNKNVKIVDLPGIYSLTANSLDESAVLTYFKSTPPDVIINIVDGTNLERNLYLTTELLDLKIPTVIAVNMADDLEKNGIVFNPEKLANELGVKVQPISALKNKNTSTLMGLAVNETVKPSPLDLSTENGEDLTSKRYSFLARAVKNCLQDKVTVASKFTVKLDDVLTHKIWGIPIFFVTITLVYFISFNAGGLFSGGIGKTFDIINVSLTNGLNSVNCPQWLIGLCSAVINGIGSVMEFLPQILVLFLLLALLEESGYTSRVAFNLDRLFRFFGLGGKSSIPLVLGCGCTVSGLMATRIIENPYERTATVMLVPFMPCGAKTAVFGWFSYKLFGGSALIATSLFFISIVCVCVFGKLLKRFRDKEERDVFLLEMPTYRLPSIKSVMCVLYDKLKEFILKAGTVMFAVSVLLWLLTNFGFQGYTNGNAQNSFLCGLGNLLKYFFYPLGFCNWQSSVAVLSGVLAKEAVVETLSALCVEPATLFYNGFSAYAFLAFVLLSPPCIASIMQAYRELGSKKDLIFMLCFQTLSAYIVALIIYLAGIIFLSVSRLLFTAIIVIIMALVIISIKKITRAKTCFACKENCKCRKK